MKENRVEPKVYDAEFVGKEEAYCNWYKCSKCGNSWVNGNAKYCSKCGVRVNPVHREETYTEDDVYKDMK